MLFIYLGYLFLNPLRGNSEFSISIGTKISFFCKCMMNLAVRNNFQVGPWFYHPWSRENITSPTVRETVNSHKSMMVIELLLYWLHKSSVPKAFFTPIPVEKSYI